VSGSATAGYIDSTKWDEAQFRSPEGVCIAKDGTLYVADTGNHAIRRCIPFGAVTTIAGTGSSGFANGPDAAARFSSPRGICRDAAGNLYVSDDGNNRIRKIDPQGNVTTYAGSGVAGDMDGSAIEAQFRDLQQLQIDGVGNLYVGCSRSIRKIDNGGNVSTVATLPEGTRIGLALDLAGNLIVTSETSKIYKVTPDGAIEVFAGNTPGYSDGQRYQAQFAIARGVGVDSIGLLYVCDGNRVRKIRPDGSVWTMHNESGPGSFPLDNLSAPRSLCIDRTGVAYIADTGNHRIRKAYSADWEQDGIPDYNEGGTSPYRIGVDDRFVDSDGDGQSNQAEYQAGSDPSDPASRFALESIRSDDLGQIVIRWQSLAGRTHTVQFSNDLTTWTDLGGSYIGTGGVLSVTDKSRGSSTRFYRVTVQ
jgi:sugar lactone lactonase YvrE